MSKYLLLISSIYFMCFSATIFTKMLSDQEKYTKRKQYLLIQDLGECIQSRKHESLQKTKIVYYLCIARKIARCLPNRTNGPTNSEADLFTKPSLTYCGMIYLGTIMKESFEFIVVVSEEDIIFTNIFLFDFQWTNHMICCTNNLTVHDYGFNEPTVFSGKRLPWTMVSFSNQVSFHVNIHSYGIVILHLSYSLHFFGSFNLFLITETIAATDVWRNKPIPVRLFNRASIVRTFHVFSHPGTYQKFSSFWYGNSESQDKITVHDGPGVLSNVILKLDKAVSKGEHTGETSTYVGFLHWHNFNESDIFKVELTYFSRIKDGSSKSTHLYNGDLENKTFNINSSRSSRSNTYRRFLINGQFKSNELVHTGWYPKFQIKNFYFHGPSAVGEKSNYNCHYGGFFFSFKQELSVYDPIINSYCNNVFNSILYGETRLLLIIVIWYNGYSSGSLDFSFGKHRCSTQYMTLTKYHSPDIKVNVSIKNIASCLNVICAPLPWANSTVFDITFTSVDRIIGPAETGLYQMDIFTGNNAYQNYQSHGCSTNKAKFYSSWAKNWPLDHTEHHSKEIVEINKLNLTKVSKSELIKKQYHFLFTFRTVIDLCIGTFPYRKGIVATFEKPTCRTNNEDAFSALNFLGNMRILSPACFDFSQLSSVLNETHYFYPVTRVTKRTLLFISYRGECPASCQNNYAKLYEVSIDNDIIYEYVSNISEETYLQTHQYHRGLRLSILPYSKQCEYDCKIGVATISPIYDTFKNKRSQIMYVANQKWLFYEKR